MLQYREVARGLSIIQAATDQSQSSYHVAQEVLGLWNKCLLLTYLASNNNEEGNQPEEPCNPHSFEGCFRYVAVETERSKK
jgi:hypothetical protein